MDLDVNCLRWARPENLERLARRLGVPLPPRGYRYQHDLVRAVARGIEDDKRRAAAEERRAMDREAAKRVAAEIAAQFGEKDERPRAQILRIVTLMGEEWTRAVAALATRVLAGDRGDLPTGAFLRLAARKNGTGYEGRTPGGVFFAVARHEATKEVGLKHCGTITRRDFFRCFTDRPPAPKTPKAPKPPIVKVVTRQVPAVHKRRTKGPVEVEVYRRR